MAHFDHLNRPTWVVVLCIIVPVLVHGFFEIFFFVVEAVCNVGIAAANFQGLGEGWENGFIVFPCFPQPVISTAYGCAFKACRSMLFAPFKRAPEAEGFGSCFDDVCSIRDPVQHRFTEPGIGKHGRPFREW